MRALGDQQATLLHEVTKSIGMISQRSKLHWLLQTFPEFIVPVALLVLLAPPVFGLFCLVRSQYFAGIVVFAVWAPLWHWIISACDRKAIVRRQVSIVATLVVLIVFAALFWNLV